MSRPHPLGWPNALAPSLSPCRIDKAKGTHQHPCSGHHASMVESYRSWRDGEYALAEEAAAGGPNEAGDEWYWQDRERPTFGAFLKMMHEERGD